ncbi:POTRA domain-containing protein, partial [Agrobacterium tumefaciens]|uniref:POTRA domain-containing protein n=1 Tax=Agrobacterium tumefaciens TaxID=358 RepID=UPI003013C4CB
MNSRASRFGGDHSIARRVAQFWSSLGSLAQPGLNSQISVSKSVAAPAAWFLSLCVTSSCFLSSGLSYAQSPAEDFSRRQEQQEQLQRLEDLKQVTPDSVISRADRAPRGDATSTGPCFDISRVEIEGATRLSAATLGTLTRPFNDRCVGVADITTLLKAITDLYLDKGFVTSRAYVPPQDIAGTRLLRLVVVEGTISDIYLNGHPVARNGAFATAFPGVKGEVANIRDIEQGLDQ